MKVKVPNDLCCEEMYQWMRDQFRATEGPYLYRYKEWLALTNRPFRTYDFEREEDATLFILRWL